MNNKLDIELITPRRDVVMAPHPDPRNQSEGMWWITLVVIRIRINGVEMEIPAGYVTDLGTVPKFTRMFVDRADESLLGFIIHDFLYNRVIHILSRKDSDRALRTIVRLCGQDMVETYLTYMFVRMLGWLFFDKHTTCYRKVPHHLIFNVRNGLGYTSREYEEL